MACCCTGQCASGCECVAVTTVLDDELWACLAAGLSVGAAAVRLEHHATPWTKHADGEERSAAAAARARWLQRAGGRLGRAVEVFMNWTPAGDDEGQHAGDDVNHPGRANWYGHLDDAWMLGASGR